MRRAPPITVSVLVKWAAMDALRHVVTVACDQQAAFDLFTTGMGSWWDPAYTPDPASFTGLDVEPEVGGVVALRTGDTAHPIGRVLVWDPPRRYAQTFWLGLDPEHPTRLDVRFDAVDDVCTVVFEHGGWTPHNRTSRTRFSDWSVLLGRFAEAAARLG